MVASLVFPLMSCAVSWPWVRRAGACAQMWGRAAGAHDRLSMSVLHASTAASPAENPFG